MTKTQKCNPRYRSTAHALSVTNNTMNTTMRLIHAMEFHYKFPGDY